VSRVGNPLDVDVSSGERITAAVAGCPLKNSCQSALRASAASDRTLLGRVSARPVILTSLRACGSRIRDTAVRHGGFKDHRTARFARLAA
jgi:hypothetical protein